MIEQHYNKIYNQDCLEFMKTLPDKCIDLVLTDPPYEFISKNPEGGGFMDKENKVHLQKLKQGFGMSYNPIFFLEECKRICKVFNGYFFTNKTLLKNYIEFAEKNGYKWDILIWSKSNPVPINNGHYLIDKEYIIFIKEKGATFNSNLGYEKYFTVINQSIGNNNKYGHPTQKPIGLIQNAIKISSKENDIVFDGYMGSGTTAEGCKILKRNYIGCEISKEYCDIAEQRIKSISNTLF